MGKRMLGIDHMTPQTEFELSWQELLEVAEDLEMKPSIENGRLTEIIVRIFKYSQVKINGGLAYL